MEEKKSVGKRYNFCTIVVTYYPDISELKRTLISIINQVDVSNQIIICDDGTKDFDSKSINSFFEKNNFYDYKIIINKKNCGTVKNMYCAKEYINAELIKTISPKDYLYSPTVYKQIYDLFLHSKFDLLAGKAIYYSKADPINIVNRNNPKKKINKSGFISNKNIINQLIKYKDWFLGATLVFGSEEMFIYYISKVIEANVKYCEDLFTVLMALDKRKIYFYNELLIWYEYGSGISTSNNTSFFRLLETDHYNFFVNYLPKKYSFKIVKKAKKFEMCKSYSTFKRRISVFFIWPLYYPYRFIYKGVLKKYDMKYDISFLDKISREE